MMLFAGFLKVWSHLIIYILSIIAQVITEMRALCWSRITSYLAIITPREVIIIPKHSISKWSPRDLIS